MTSDLKRLPILRSMCFYPDAIPAFAAVMQAAGLSTLEVVCILWNSEEPGDADDIICRWSGWLLNNAGSPRDIICDTESWPFMGGVLLNDTICATITVGGNQAPAGSACTVCITMNMMLEVDWVPITKAQLEEYILEHVFARD